MATVISLSRAAVGGYLVERFEQALEEGNDQRAHGALVALQLQPDLLREHLRLVTGDETEAEELAYGFIMNAGAIPLRRAG